MHYGRFDDSNRQYVITSPATPRPWINYLGNRRLHAFISQNAGGLLWFREPYSRRISRYHHLPAPGDRPGFYIYVHDRRTDELWNPHFAPTCSMPDSFECRHEPGVTQFAAAKAGIHVDATYCIPPEHDVMLWRVRVSNHGDADADLRIASYLEFGLLEFMREAVGWCYLKSHNAFSYHPETQSIRYDYHVFEAPYLPAMEFACVGQAVVGFECSRDSFVGRTGSLERPESLRGAGLRNSQLPLGGHGCGTLAADLRLAPGQQAQVAYVFAIGDTWQDTGRLLSHFSRDDAFAAAIAATRAFWAQRLETLQVASPDQDLNRFVNVWNPCNAVTALDLARTISTDHVGLDGLRYRDTTQDALAVAAIDPAFAIQRMDQVFEQQASDGRGCFSFFPHTERPTTDAPDRSDNTVWQIFTIDRLIAETGDLDILQRRLRYRDRGADTVFDHIVKGLRYIDRSKGPHGLPRLRHADWNDGLAVFADEAAESVMLGMQMVHACQLLADYAELLDRPGEAHWATRTADELTRILNAPPVWDGAWYARLLLSDGTAIGSSARREGRIYLNPQSWAVLAGVADADRATRVMAAVAEHLDTDAGLRILAPPYTGIPEPEDPPRGSMPGTNENGSIFCHANTWAIIAETQLGHAQQAYRYYRQLLPTSVISRFGDDHYGREPYVYVSSITGPPADQFGQGGISWLTGTASWMYVAATQHILGIRPTLDGLLIAPCLPDELPEVRVRRRFRGTNYDILLRNVKRGKQAMTVNGAAWDPAVPIPPQSADCRVECQAQIQRT